MLQPYRLNQRKPRTYRRLARKAYLAVAKQRKTGFRTLRKAVGIQLRYLRRNLRAIDEMATEGMLVHLSRRMYRHLLVIHEMYRQQWEMFTHHTHRIENRIVSLTQPHLRPIVRGKAKCPVKFGSKVSVSLVDSVGFVDAIHWDNVNESQDLVDQIEGYRRRFRTIPSIGTCGSDLPDSKQSKVLRETRDSIFEPRPWEFERRWDICGGGESSKATASSG
jgi:hypothetical protein